jgi:tetratricopeptide (TPR) repeat protein
LNPKLAEAHQLLANVATGLDYDWRTSEAEWQKAIHLAPNDPFMRANYSIMLAFRGRFAEGLSEAQRAKQLDPAIGLGLFAEGVVQFLARRYSPSISSLERALALPNHSNADQQLAHVLVEVGRFDEALKLVRYTGALPPSPMTCEGSTGLLASQAFILARADRAEEARALLGRINECADRQPTAIVLTQNAAVHVALQEFDRALKLLNESVDDHNGWSLWLRYDPRFDPLRRDPRFAAILRRLHLTQ